MTDSKKPANKQTMNCAHQGGGQDALRDREDRYQAVIEASADGFLVADREGRILEVNEAYLRRSGHTRQQLLGMSIADLDAHPDPAETAGRIGKIVHDGSGRFETVHRAKDGSPWHVQITAAFRPTDGGRLFAFVHDITKRKLAEETIRQDELFITNILDSVDEGFIVVDREFRIVTANRAYCHQVSLPCEQVVGRRCYEVSHRTNRPCFEDGTDCAVHQVFTTGLPHAVVHRHTGSDGQMLLVESKAYPVRDASGAITRAIETTTNITERHLLEEERLKTQRLESLGTLAGGIAHDFNNLLQGVLGYLSMAKVLAGEKDKALAMLAEAEKSLRQAVDLTSQLLTFSKGGKPVTRSIDPVPAVRSAATFALSGSRSELQFHVEPGLWNAEADEGQLGQVIQSVVLNADQAMPAGGTVAIELRNLPAAEAGTHRGLEQRDYVEIRVQDQGSGIPAEELDKIFDIYYTTKEKGSGLGLATSYSIIRNHGGLIDVRSEVGKGSTFFIFLPASPAAGGDEGVGAPAPTAKGSARVLVMDDDEVVRKVAGELLFALGHKMAFAENGAAALELYRLSLEGGSPFDVVILDLTVRGGMGGAEALQRLRVIDPGVKAIVSSGYSDDAIVASYRQYGFSAVLKKPYDLEQLRSTLNGVLA